jgi:acyl carrier protein
VTEPSSTVGAPSPDAVLETLSSMIGEVIGPDELLLVDEITLETSFNDDLELESIEFVALAELLMEHYGERVDFVAWIADMELEQIIEMRVGELVAFIVGCLADEGPADEGPADEGTAA